VICGDFSKGLGAAIKLKAFQDQCRATDPDQDFPKLRSVAYINDNTIVVKVTVRDYRETTFL
jgi:hypothetical protein